MALATYCRRLGCSLITSYLYCGVDRVLVCAHQVETIDDTYCKSVIINDVHGRVLHGAPTYLTSSSTRSRSSLHLQCQLSSAYDVRSGSFCIPVLSCQTNHARPPCTRRATESDLGPLTPQSETVTLAYAIKVDDECINRWGEALYDTLYPGSRDEMSPDELRKKLDCWLVQWRIVIVEHMAYEAYETYCNFPDIP